MKIQFERHLIPCVSWNRVNPRCICGSILHTVEQNEWRKTTFEAHSEQQLLTPTVEKAVVRCNTILENCGFPLRVEHVMQAGELIVRMSLGGGHWIARLLNRHPMFGTKLTSPFEQGRHDSEDQLIALPKSNELLQAKVLSRRIYIIRMIKDF